MFVLLAFVLSFAVYIFLLGTESSCFSGNIAIGIGLLAAVGGIFAYTLRSVSQNDFREFEHERETVVKKAEQQQQQQQQTARK